MSSIDQLNEALDLSKFKMSRLTHPIHTRHWDFITRIPYSEDMEAFAYAFTDVKPLTIRCLIIFAFLSSTLFSYEAAILILRDFYARKITDICDFFVNRQRGCLS